MQKCIQGQGPSINLASIMVLKVTKSFSIAIGILPPSEII